MRPSLILSIATAFLPLIAFGSTIVVDNPGDMPVPDRTTLRQAVAASAADDIITFAVDQPIVLTQGQIGIDHNLTLQGPAAGTQSIQRADNSAAFFRLFKISHGPVAFSHLDLSGGLVGRPTRNLVAPPHDAQGGAILNAATLTVSDCRLEGNSVEGDDGRDGARGEAGANGEGGAIYNSGSLIVTRCSLQGNTASGGLGGSSSAGPGGAAGLAAGGAIFNAGTAVVTDSTFAENDALGARGGVASPNESNGKGGATQGGAIANVSSLSLVSVTLADNLAQAGAAGFGGLMSDQDGGAASGGALFTSHDPGAVTIIRSSLVARSLIFGGTSSAENGALQRGPAKGQNVFGSVQSDGFNLIENADGSTGWIGSDQIGGATKPIQPLLQTLVHDNGGATLTYSLKPGSPAIDQGNSLGLTTDARGLDRVYDDPAIANAAGGDGSDVGAFELQPAPPSNLQNVSTRGNISGGDGVLIAGFIVNGEQGSTIAFRAIGPDTAGNLPTLADPLLELHDANGNLFASNDNWMDGQGGVFDVYNLEPVLPNDSALLLPLSPGNFTAVVRGADGGTGVGLIEAYDLTPQSDSTLANISSRGQVGPGDDAIIVGFILGSGGGGSTKVAIRALGPSLGFGAAGLQDPTLELFDADGVMIASNDDWKDTQKATVTATGLAPTDNHEAALVIDLPPDDYTAVVRGKNGSAGIALVEVYRLP